MIPNLAALSVFFFKVNNVSLKFFKQIWLISNCQFWTLHQGSKYFFGYRSCFGQFLPKVAPSVYFAINKYLSKGLFWALLCTFVTESYAHNGKTWKTIPYCIRTLEFYHQVKGYCSDQAHSQGGAGDAMLHPNLAKGPLLATKWAQNRGFCRRVGGVEVQKVHFLGPKGPLLGGSASTPIWSWLRAWQWPYKPIA